jgi:hypothetical protein
MSLSRLILLSLISTVTYAQNFSGTWSWSTAGTRGSSTRVLVLNHVGDEVTGTITPQTNGWTSGPFDGAIHGGRVDKSGNLRFHVWFLRDEPVPQVFEGKLSANGREITFTVTTGEGYPPPLVKSLTPRGERNAARPAPFQVTASRVR